MDEFYEMGERRDWIYIVFGFFECQDQFCGICYLFGDYNFVGIFMIEFVFMKEFFIIGYVEKFYFIIWVFYFGMVKNVGWFFYWCFWYGGGDQFIINFFVDI